MTTSPGTSSKIVRALREPSLILSWLALLTRRLRRRGLLFVLRSGSSLKRATRRIRGRAGYTLLGVTRSGPDRTYGQGPNGAWGRMLRRMASNGAAILHQEEALAAFSEHRWQEAADSFQAALEHTPDQASAWLGLARARFRTGDLDGARVAGSRAWDLAPMDANTLAFLGTVLLKQGRGQELGELLDMTCGDHADPPVLRAAVDLHRRRGDVASAERLLTRLRTAIPDENDELLLTAELLFATDEIQRADELALSGDPKEFATLSRHVHYFCRTGRAQAAAKLLEREGTGERTLASEVARSLAQQGWLRDAASTYSRILEANPADRDAEAGRQRSRGELTALRGTWQRPGMPVASSAFAMASSARVLHIVGRSLPYAQAGYGIRTQRIAYAQRRVGIDAHVVTQLGFPDIPTGTATEEHEGVTYHRLTLDGEGRPSDPQDRLQRNLERLIPVVERLRPALLHAASDYLNGSLALELGERFDLPVVYEARGFWEETWLSKQPFPGQSAQSDRYKGRRAAELRCMRGADAVVTLAEVMRDRIIADGVDADRVHVVPNAVDPDDFAPRPRPEELARELGFSSEDIVVGYISSLVDYEGVDDLVGGLLELRTREPRARGLIVGDGPARQLIEQQVRDAGAEDIVHLTGRISHDKVRDYYELIDIFVVPRKAHRVCELVTPLKPFEALAMGKPLVVSDLPALREVVREAGGRTFPAGDRSALARILEELCDEPMERSRMAEQGRRWVRSERTWQHIAQRYLDLYSRFGVP